LKIKLGAVIAKSSLIGKMKNEPTFDQAIFAIKEIKNEMSKEG